MYVQNEQEKKFCLLSIYVYIWFTETITSINGDMPISAPHEPIKVLKT